MAVKTTIASFHKKPHAKHPGVHSKNRHSNNKKSKMYQKKYRGQGR